MRNSFGIKDSEIILLSLGRVAKEKNIEEIIKYFAIALKGDDKFYLMVAGGGPEKDNLFSLSKSLGLEHRVIFTGMIEPSEVYKYYQLADVFVSSSTSETQGLTFIEAMANGLPLLCRVDDSLSGVLLDGENGFYYCDEFSFKQGAYALTDKNLRRLAGSKSKELSKPYDKLEFGKNAVKLYEEVLKKHAI